MSPDDTYITQHISIHASGWRATWSPWVEQWLSIPISIHASGWRATDLREPIAAPEIFLSTPPGGGRHLTAVAVVLHRVFLSTPPGGGRPDPSVWICGLHVFLSTPPGGGRPVEPEGYIFKYGISIHASGWRATPLSHLPDLAGNISIHASGWRATFQCFRLLCRTPISIHASGWRATASINFDTARSRCISIHASGWRATQHRDHCRGDLCAFLSTPPGGGRPMSFNRFAAFKVFLSTPPGGGRLCEYAPLWT